MKVKGVKADTFGVVRQCLREYNCKSGNICEGLGLGLKPGARNRSLGDIKY